MFRLLKVIHSGLCPGWVRLQGFLGANLVKSIKLSNLRAFCIPIRRCLSGTRASLFGADACSSEPVTRYAATVCVVSTNLYYSYCFCVQARSKAFWTLASWSKVLAQPNHRTTLVSDLAPKHRRLRTFQQHFCQKLS